MRKVVLTLKEKHKYDVIKKLVETDCNKTRAANEQKLSERQIRRLIDGYKEFGKAFFVHRNRGRKPVHALSDELKNQIEDLYNTKYFDCTYTQFSEFLAERENIVVSIDEVRCILKERFILSPRSHKITKKNIKKLLLQQKNKLLLKKKLLKFKRIL